MQEMQIPPLCQEDFLEKEMATHSNIPAWKTPWTEEPGGLQYLGSQRVRHDWVIIIIIKLRESGRKGEISQIRGNNMKKKKKIALLINMNNNKIKSCIPS